LIAEAGVILSDPVFTVVRMREHPEAVLRSQLTQLLDQAGRIPVTGLFGPELDSVIEDGLTLISRLTMHVTAAVDQAEALDRPSELAAPSLVSWLRGRFRQTPRDASRIVRDMKALRAAPAAAEAALLGAISVPAAAAIGQAITELPDEVGPELRAEGETVLLGYAIGCDGEQLHARELALAGRHLHEVLDPDAADRLLAERLAREEAITWRRRYLSITSDGEGGIRLRGLLTAEAGATLHAVLDPLAAPRPAAPAAMDSAAVARPGETAQQPDALTADEMVLDDRTSGQRYADALVEVAERALTHGELPDTAGQRPQLLITLDHDQLSAGIGAGTLTNGEPLSPSTIRRLACDAGIIPAILGSHGQVLDLGRSARTATPAQRKALAVRDDGCAFPGCDRPPGWADAHHIQHWEHLGPTDLANLVLLCGYHHRTVHHDGWEITPPKDGVRPEFVPPPWMDPHRRPRRNLQHHIRDLLRASPD
jgi:hypothetical protein